MINLAKYDVTYSCGHSEEVQLVGPMQKRETKLNWYRTEAVCPACYRAQRQAELQQEIETIRGDYAELHGSEKQIAWASEIRLEFVKDLDGLVKKNTPVQDQDIIRRILRTIVNSHPESKWWIDNRYNLRSAINHDYVAAVKEAGLH